MTRPIRLTKHLTERPPIALIPGVSVRTFEGEADIEAWLRIRNSAFSELTASDRTWRREDFEREFLRKPWWRWERMWFAEIGDRDVAQPMKLVGTATCGETTVGLERFQTVQWLAILPEWRGRGIGQLLLATLEAACWDAGYRTIELETLPTWEAAMRLYAAAGYKRSD